MRVFLDTNVLASAFGSTGLCAELLQIVLQNHQLITSEKVLEELQRVLPRQFDATAQETGEAIAIVRGYEVQDLPDVLPEIDVRDRDDLLVLAAAIAAQADVLVTGDRDLLVVAAESPVPILTPRKFFELLQT